MVQGEMPSTAAHGLYLSPDVWEDGFYLLQARYAQAIFSHETALYLWDLAAPEPLRYTVTVKAGYTLLHWRSRVPRCTE